MAISHFLRAESGLHIRKNGFSTTMRWFSVAHPHPDTESDTEVITQLKKTVAIPKEQRAEKVESFVRKYMESNSGKFPNPTTIQKEVGGSYYTVKELLATVKEKTYRKQKQLGNDQKPNLVKPLASDNSDVNSSSKQNNGNDSDNAVKTTDSGVNAVNVSSSSSELRGNGDEPEQKVPISKSDFQQRIIMLSKMFREKTCDEPAMENNKQLVSDSVEEDQVSQRSKSSTFSDSPESESPRNLLGLFWPGRSLDFSGSRSHSSEDEKNTLESDFVPNDQAREGNTHVKSSQSKMEILLDRKDERQEKETKGFDINFLMGAIKKMPLMPSVSEPSENNTPTIPKIDETSRATQNDLPKERKTSPMFNFVHTDDNEVEGPSSKNTPTNSKTTQDEKSTSPKMSEQQKPSLSGNVLNDDVQNEKSGAFKVVVKFLPKHVNEKTVHDVLSSCGDISSIELRYVGGAAFRHANVYFKTNEGLTNALRKHVINISSYPVIIEASDNVANGISKGIRIPDLIGVPDFPVALGKNPTRTVMIQPLTQDIRPCHVESALSFYGCKVTGFFLGSSNSVAYVELETEEAKEKALAKHAIDVSGKKVMISRIDVPRTTVVRIFHSSPRTENLHRLYNSVGKVRSVRSRSPNITDVYYTFPEWPNMMNVLNRLNTSQVDGQAVVAQPATIIPPDILSLLWAHPDERKQVVSIMQGLLQKMEEESIIVQQRFKIPDLIENMYGAKR